MKVFRTPVGFHDAYVAAPSRKAALKAWGTDRNLFAHGAAEEVDDPDLMKEPLAQPGVVIKRSRGTVAQQIAALPKDETNSRRAKPPLSETSDKPAPKAKAPEKKRAPKPSRDKLSAAESAIERAEHQHEKARKALAARERKLAVERDLLERGQCDEMDALRKVRDRSREAYEGAIRDWNG
jgi:hypothetical protein